MRGRAKTRLREAYVAARFSGRYKTQTRAAPKRSGSVRLIRAGFEPFRAAAIQTRFYKCANR